MRAVCVALLAAMALSCVDLTWKEGIACDPSGACPGNLRCCGGTCRASCAGDAASDGPRIVTCPPQPGGCYACMPGCACTCGATQGICCELAGVATCVGCP